MITLSDELIIVYPPELPRAYVSPPVVPTIYPAVPEVGDTLVVPVAGARGAPGAPGVTGTTYLHHQTNPSSSWLVPHNLGYSREPTLLLDTAPTVPVWADVVHQDVNHTIIMLPEPATGWAYF